MALHLADLTIQVQRRRHAHEATVPRLSAGQPMSLKLFGTFIPAGCSLAKRCSASMPIGRAVLLRHHPS